MSNVSSIVGQCPKCDVLGPQLVSTATHHPMTEIQPVTCGNESCKHQTLLSQWQEQGQQWQYVG